MPARVFVSCGQATDEERDVANRLSDWLSTLGFDVYVAIQTQSLADVDSGIIGHLRSSDYYLFIDYRRENVGSAFRGSLFTHQELAIAYVLGFEEAIFLQEKGVELNGVAKYLLTNASKFEKRDQVLPLVQQLVTERTWSSNYTRHLRAAKVELSMPSPIPYGYDADHCRIEHIYHVFVENRRRDVVAMNTLARLESIKDSGGAMLPLDDTSRLKWGKQTGFDRAIFPGDAEPFDAFAIDAQNQSHVYLHSTRDIWPQQPVINTPGVYRLRYQVFAQQFPMLEFDVELALTGHIATTSSKLV